MSKDTDPRDLRGAGILPATEAELNELGPGFHLCRGANRALNVRNQADRPTPPEAERRSAGQQDVDGEAADGVGVMPGL